MKHLLNRSTPRPVHPEVERRPRRAAVRARARRGPRARRPPPAAEPL